MGASQLATGELGRFGVRITNLSSQAGRITIAPACTGNLTSCAVYDQGGLPITRTRALAPDSSQVVLVEYRAGPVAGTGTAGLNASYESATDAISWGVTVGDATIRPPAIVSAPGDFADAPAASGQRFVLVENPWSRERTFSLSASSTNASVLAVSSGSSLWLGAGGSRSVSLTYSVAGNAARGATSTYGLTVSDGVATSASATSLFTVADAAENPLVLAPADFSVQPDQSGSVNFRVVSRTNASQSYALTVTAGGVVRSASTPASVLVAAYDTAQVKINYQIIAAAQSGATGDILLQASAGGMSGSGVVQVSTNLALNDPTVLAPADQNVAPGESGRSSFTIGNNANSVRTLKLSAARSGIVANTDVQASIDLFGGQQRPERVDWTIASTAVAGTTGNITVTASDGAYSGSASQKFTASLSQKAPTVEGTGDLAVLSGASGTKGFTVRNNTNANRSLALTATRSGII
jgi:hypothetical protein